MVMENVTGTAVSGVAPMRETAGRPTPPRTELQSRIADAVDVGLESRMKVSGGGPEDMSEIDREITMLNGALHGVDQRLAELVARLQPVLPRDTVEQILAPQDGPAMASPSNLDPMTDVGTRLRRIHRHVSEVEYVLSYLLAVRL